MNAADNPDAMHIRAGRRRTHQPNRLREWVINSVMFAAVVCWALAVGLLPLSRTQETQIFLGALIVAVVCDAINGRGRAHSTS